MDPLTSTAASGMRSRMESLDLLANNMSNASAAGFKADREFYGLYLSAEASGQPSGSDQPTMPVIERHWTDFGQGSLTSTENPLDIAISGNGFFSVQSPAGTLFTRDGSFRISPQGDIETSNAYKLLDQDGKPIRIDSSKPVEITADGMVRQDGLDVARISVVTFPDVHSLAKHGQNYFQVSVDNVKPTPASQVEILQGKLENANFQPAESAVRLVTVLRQFENLQRALSVGTEMNKRAVEDVARVS